MLLETFFFSFFERKELEVGRIWRVRIWEDLGDRTKYDKNILHKFLKIKMQKFPSFQILNISVFSLHVYKYVQYAIHKDALLRKPNPKSVAK